ncbi:MAG: HEAT repeat domain-containing protein, partial [Gemmatimonadales bacterium]
ALGDAVTTAMVELAVNSDDSRLRAHVWSLLSVESDPYLVAPLLSALVNDPDERGREAAASGLAQFLEHPGVREGLEEALVYDASLLVRKRAEESLESVNR